MKHSIIEHCENKEKEWTTILDQYELAVTYRKTSKNQSLILPLDLCNPRYKKIEKAQLFQRLKAIKKPILFINRIIEKRATLIIKYTGEENYYPLIQELSQRKLVQQKAIIISPNHLSKIKRAKELKLVRQVSAFFNPTFFIKLPLFKLQDYIQFARNEKYPLLLLPFDDLEKYIDTLSGSKNSQTRIDAAFQNNERSSAIFLPKQH